MDQTLTSAQLGRRWNFHQGSVRRMANEGRLPVIKIGGRLRFPVNEIEAIEAARRVKVAKPAAAA